MKNLEEAIKTATAAVFHFGLLTHTAHFNVIGPRFYELHILLERIYQDVEASFDDFGEHIRALDIMCPHSLKEYMILTPLQDTGNVTSSSQLIHDLLVNNELLIEVLNEVNNLSTSHIGLQNFIQGRVEVHEKHGWMLRATLELGK